MWQSVCKRDGPRRRPQARNRSAEPCRRPCAHRGQQKNAHPQGTRFIFVEDDGAAYAAHINELLRSLNVNGEEEAQPADTEQTED